MTSRTASRTAVEPSASPLGGGRTPRLVLAHARRPIAGRVRPGRARALLAPRPWRDALAHRPAGRVAGREGLGRRLVDLFDGLCILRWFRSGLGHDGISSRIPLIDGCVENED